MRVYNFYSISRDGHVTGPPKHVVADDDQTAVKDAKQQLDGHDIEIWEGARLIAYLVHDKDKGDTGMGPE